MAISSAERPSSHFELEEQELRETAETLNNFLIVHGNRYQETLNVNSQGKILTEERIGDSQIPFLPSLLKTMYPDDAMAEPTIEDLYSFLKHLQERLPQFIFNVIEDPSRRWIRYTVRKDL